MLILNLEDDPNYAGLIKEMLQEFSVELVQVSTVAQASKWIVQHRPDLIITDISLGGGKSGLEFIRATRQIEDFSTVPTIFLSAIDAPEVKLEALELQPSVYLVKPVRWADFSEAIQKFLNTSTSTAHC